MRRTTMLLAVACVLACTAPEPPDRPAPTDEPAAAPLPSEGVVMAADGVPIAFEAAGSAETTLVFVHCWACDRTFWNDQLDVFAGDYRVVALDLAGHGESGTERGSWSVGGLAEDVATVLEELDLRDVVLVGHSMGGPVSLLTVPLARERVVGVVLVDTVHNAEVGWSAEDAAPVIAAFSEDYEATTRQFTPMLFPPDADPEIVARVTEGAVATDHTAAIQLLADFPNLDLAAILAAAEVPVRAVNAAPLGQMIPETAIETNRRYADFDALILEDVGHYPMLEKPEEFNRLLAQALDDVLSAASGDPDPGEG